MVGAARTRAAFRRRRRRARLGGMVPIADAGADERAVLHARARLGLRSRLPIDRPHRPLAQDAYLRRGRRSVALARRPARADARGLPARRRSLDRRRGARRRRSRARRAVRRRRARDRALVVTRRGGLTVARTAHRARAWTTRGSVTAGSK